MALKMAARFKSGFNGLGQLKQSKVALRYKKVLKV